MSRLPGPIERHPHHLIELRIRCSSPHLCEDEQKTAILRVGCRGEGCAEQPLESSIRPAEPSRLEALNRCRAWVSARKSTRHNWTDGSEYGPVALRESRVHTARSMRHPPDRNIFAGERPILSAVMTDENASSLLAGTLALMRYRASDGGMIICTWGDLSAETPPAQLARGSGATSYGLIAFEGVPDAPRLPVMWFRTDWDVQIRPAPIDDPLSDRLRAMIRTHLHQFFDDTVRMWMADEHPTPH